MEKQIPAVIELSPETSQFIYTNFIVQQKFAFIILILLGFALLAIAVVIFSPWQRVVKWISGTLLGISIFLSLFVISLYRLQDVPFFDGFSPASFSLLELGVYYPLSLLTRFTFFIAVVAIFLYGLAVLFPAYQAKKASKEITKKSKK